MTEECTEAEFSEGRILYRVNEIVDILNDFAFDKQLSERANFSGTDTFLGIYWGDWTLWDTEGRYRDGMDFDDEECWEPTVELCVRMILNHASRQQETAKALYEHFIDCPPSNGRNLEHGQ